MRNSLPDLFDAQPDLLFQLVTMLNPSVLQENRVPVYSVLQEPGNFVITFPRSYHGGFNFGLNCAEAVNFAPADWLPHGGFGADLYKMYHKTAVLSHEELLCVVAKFQGNIEGEVSPYLKKELLRIYTIEKSRRERLWRRGIIKSSPMPPRKCPEYVGTEEDPTCLICKQYLYLSAVVCHCRPSAFVCLEHWEHICECKRSRLRLLYRFSLAELYALVFNVDKCGSAERLQNNSSQRHNSSSEMNVLTKKVKGGHISLAELADQWLVWSCKILENSYSGDAYSIVLKEAEQFLWAGFEMNPVREKVKILIVAQKWAEGVRDCASKVKNWSSHSSCGFKRVDMEHITALLNFDPVPCNEPGYLKLKEHAEEAKLLIQDIESALSSCSKVSQLELLYSRTCDFPIYLKESEKLLQKISSAKAWMECARKCISENSAAAVDIDMLDKLKSEIPKLQVELPEEEMLLNLVRQAESCQARCREILKFPIRLEDVESLLQKWNKFKVNVPELMLIKEYHLDTISWIGNCNDLLVDIHEREDQEIVVNQLQCLLKDGSNLRIQVDEKLSLIEVELKKACCRQKALKVRDSKMSLDFVQQVIVDSTALQIENEKLFNDLSVVLVAALSWEERASKILEKQAHMSEFEDILRCAKNIFLILPTLDDVKNAVATAKCWLKNSEALLGASISTVSGSCSLRKLEALKELILQSKSLKINFEERRMLEIVLRNCEEWEQVACCALQDAVHILGTSCIADGLNDDLTTRIEILAAKMEAITKSGFSIGFDFLEIQKLQSASLMLQWCNKALSFCSAVPSLKDVDSLLEASENLSVAHISGSLFSSLTDGVKWLRKALEALCGPCEFARCQFSEAEEILLNAQSINISFPMVIDQLVNAIQKHKLWQEQVHQFFHLNSEKRSLSQMLELKELGKADAFSCSELDMILIEVDKVEKWKNRCMEIVQIFVHVENHLLGALKKIKQSLDISLHIYGKSFLERDIPMCCTEYDEDQELLSCSTCKDRYHMRCLGPSLVGVNDAKVYICPYCHFLEDPSSNQNEVSPLTCGRNRPELSMLIRLVSDAENFFVRLEEKYILLQIVELALQCKTCLEEVLGFESSHTDKDLSIVSKKIIIALKAIQVAGVYDHQSNDGIELAVARYSWRMKAKRLLDSQQKPTMQHVQGHIKVGAVINIPPEDYFRQKLKALEHIGLQWADTAKKVALDSGARSLDEVCELISAGENLPVHTEKELELLRSRSMLYCICRKPHDDRAKVTCDRCGEWYHVDCIKLPFPRKIYVCAACDPQYDASTSSEIDFERLTCEKSVEPKTPSPRLSNSRKKPIEKEVSVVGQEVIPISSRKSSTLIESSGIDRLWWRNRKPFRRAAKKRAELQCLSPLFHIQQQKE
ncbi:lysine-specific demethylase JMJ17 isoform X2 [Euphorbia lathyris]